jgi:CHRD domain
MKTKVLGVIAICTIAATSFAATMTSEAATLTYTASLSGPAESPPNASPGTGFAQIVIDTVLQTMTVDVSFSGLLGTTTASHIHCCTAIPGTGTAGVATTTPTFAGFPLGVTSGTYHNVLDLTSASSYNPAFVTLEGSVALAEAALLAGLAADETYLNIHSSVVPGGEIRGFLVTPLPAALPLFASGLGALGLLGWRRKRKAIAA